MSGENRQLVTDEPVGFETSPVEVWVSEELPIILEDEAKPEDGINM
jgi:hypothetical protein